MESINVLWTGGLDSTYLVVKLAMTTNGVIQPYYILDENRDSYHKELEAINKITSCLRKKDGICANLLDTKVVSKFDILPNSNISNSWLNLNKECKLGNQYDFLARFAKQNDNMKLMVGVLCNENSRVLKSISGKINLIEQQINSFSFYSAQMIENGDVDSFRIYENILFPICMQKKSKVEEWQELKDGGCLDIANMTWFCHHPVWGLPCGHCNPCKDALDEGMQFRVPITGRCLYYVKKIFDKLLK